MYSDVFCKVYDMLGWNAYPEIFAYRLLAWMQEAGLHPGSSMDLACGTGVLCEILFEHGIRACGTDLSPGMIRVARSRNDQIRYAVEDMVRFCPEERYDLVTCTGDALNHISAQEDLKKIFQNVFCYLSPGGHFVFDILDEQEISDSEPFEMDFTDTLRVWFQMLRPAQQQVELTVRLYENGALTMEQVIRETVHDRSMVCLLLEQAGFQVERCAHSLREQDPNGTTWYVIAKKP